MDNEIRHRLEELVRAIGASEEYRTYEEARGRLELDPEKKKRANDFRRKNFHCCFVKISTYIVCLNAGFL